MIKNGILLMGLSAMAILLATGGRVQILVVMYSINVFITFTLSQLGMCRHWLQVRNTDNTWLRKFLPNAVGMTLCSGILVMTTVFKFGDGGWATIALTGCFVLVCFQTRSHYGDIRVLLRNLDDRLMNLPPGLGPPADRKPDAKRPVAGLLVTKFDGLGIHSILTIKRLFHEHYDGIVFLSVGIIDSNRFKGADEVQHLEQETDGMLRKYVDFCGEHGVAADYRYTLGTDAVDEIVGITLDAVKDYPQLVVFAGKLIFASEQVHHRLLHNETAASVQRRLHLRNVPMMVLPIKAD
ncbi:MAG: amino acid permease [bacterium]|nr:MAG: amino acid permease [bacterium]